MDAGAGGGRYVTSSRDIESITFTSDGPPVTVMGPDKDRALTSPVTLFAGGSWKLDVELRLFGAPSATEESAARWEAASEDHFQGAQRIDSELAWTMDEEGIDLNFGRI